jgi:hypothetical protein
MNDEVHRGDVIVVDEDAIQRRLGRLLILIFDDLGNDPGFEIHGRDYTLSLRTMTT